MTQNQPILHCWVDLLQCFETITSPEMTRILLLLAISKRIELQLPDWHQKMGNLKKFQNLTDFCQSMASKPDYSPFAGVRFFGAIVISRMLLRDRSERSEHRGKRIKAKQAEQSALEQMSEQVEQSKRL